MKQHLRLGGGLFGAGVAVLVAQAPVWAAPTKVTAVQLTQTSSGFNIILATEKGDRPQVFTINDGNSFRATITNTQLSLPQGNAFRQENPSPGIASVEVTQIDANSIRIVVAGNGNAPAGQIVQTQGQGIVFSVAQGRGTPTASVPAMTPPPPPDQPLSQTVPPPPANLPLSQTAPAPQIRTAQSPNVMVPNPQVTITRNEQPPLPEDIQPSLNQAPPFQSRAVAPPLGDIAVSNIDPSPSAINLNTSERIPRLVLRDAPVRDVLALLARAAGVNIAFTGDNAQGQTGQAAQPGVPNQGASATNEGQKISLDIENESVQDVFNYVLRLSGLQANRVGRTIFVGTTLPVEARNLITRSFRLNQVQAGQAAAFLSAQGAETQRVVNIVRRTVTGTGVDRNVTEENSVEIRPLGAVQGSGALLLRGLSVLTDERLNAITLIGTPRQIEVASAFLTQLDLRRRQVAVNVKVIDINLSGQNNYSSSFSFGINNNFFVNDGGSATLNFGGINPPNTLTTRSSLTGRPIVPNPISGNDPFYEQNNQTNVPLTSPGGGLFLNPRSPVGNNPNQVGIQDYTSFERTLNGANAGQLSSVGDATFALYPLFQYPTRFLSQLQAQIVTNNAKILTDPTLVVQEGETAGVNLTQQVITNITTQTTAGTGLTTQTVTAEKGNAGLTLNVEVTRIDDNGFISMRINPTVRAIANDTNLGNNQISLLQERSLSSGLIRLRDGQTLIVSGIINDTERVRASKIPILGDLPLIGSLFRSTTKTNQRAEVIVLVTPQILDDSDRSSFGYQYNPSPDARQMLQRGVPIQQR
ncbi:AMIN domain-containing protein [Kamptonema sp. UHCC 0994]|uniref:AMIN domain-containing protein n=1 Tax=Kamptonema sp. UHCC 0994 TaxID=3031329 RepID=UPI0023B8D8DA|nr:AMIN domain-containing protein [Kamptonema sp. UHCC 0994]MDF0554136.1 AMIN domain-containing protein [Kamptonema sp. UHCC 0994]